MAYDITPFETSPHSPYPVGEVPRAGWYAIEPTCEWEVKDEVALRSALGITCPTDYEEQQRLPHHKARLTPPDLAGMASSFDPAINAGVGLLVTEEHSLFSANPTSKSIGWIKELHAEGDRLWAWIEWTVNGHRMMDSGDYIFFSTEYDYPDFELQEDGTVVPRRLAALAVTNNPNHTGQVPVTNNRDLPSRDINTMNTRAKMAATKPAARKRDTNAADVDPALGKDKQTDVNADDTDPNKPDCNTDVDPDKETDINMDDESGEGDAALELISQIADVMELDSSATAEDVLAAVQDMQSKIGELTEALAAANSSAKDTNSRRYPNLFGRSGRDTNTPLRGDRPNRDINLRVAGQTRQVNSQDKMMVDYCNKHIAAQETKYGRQLNSAEYTREMSIARSNYRDSQ